MTTSTKHVEKQPTSLTELAASLHEVYGRLEHVFLTSELVKAKATLQKALDYIRDRKKTDHGLDELYTRAEHKYGGRITLEAGRHASNKHYLVRVLSWSLPVREPIAAEGKTLQAAVEGIEDQLDAQER